MSSNAYHAEWDKTHTTQIKLKLNRKTDADILAPLKSQPSMQGYIKTLIRRDLEQSKNK